MKEVKLYIIHGLRKGKSHIYCVTTWKDKAELLLEDIEDEGVKARITKSTIEIRASL